MRGEYDGRVLDEDLLLERHRRICADLIPDLAGRWRSYLAALRAADRNDWRPLMDIWRERFEESDIE